MAQGGSSEGAITQQRGAEGVSRPSLSSGAMDVADTPCATAPKLVAPRGPVCKYGNEPLRQPLFTNSQIAELLARALLQQTPSLFSNLRDRKSDLSFLEGFSANPRNKWLLR